MNKDQQYKIIFENWKNHNKEEVDKPLISEIRGKVIKGGVKKGSTLVKGLLKRFKKTNKPKIKTKLTPKTPKPKKGIVKQVATGTAAGVGLAAAGAGGLSAYLAIAEDVPWTDIWNSWLGVVGFGKEAEIEDEKDLATLNCLEKIMLHYINKKTPVEDYPDKLTLAQVQKLGCEGRVDLNKINEAWASMVAHVKGEKNWDWVDVASVLGTYLAADLAVGAMDTVSDYFSWEGVKSFFSTVSSGIVTWLGFRKVGSLFSRLKPGKTGANKQVAREIVKDIKTKKAKGKPSWLAKIAKSRVGRAMKWPLILYGVYQTAGMVGLRESSGSGTLSEKEFIDLFTTVFREEGLDESPFSFFPDFKIGKTGHDNMNSDSLKDYPPLPQGKDGLTRTGNIVHNLSGFKKSKVDLFIRTLKEIGITNEYSIIGALAVAGKESGFRSIEEKGGYSFNRIKQRSGAVARRVWRRWKQFGFGDPTDEHIRAITGGGRNAIALFNIAYGYSKSQGPERINIPPCVPGPGGELIINELMYDKSLAGWKYRGRGMVQCTFRSGYVAFAKAAGLSVDQVLADPRVVSTDPVVSCKMSAGVIKYGYNKAVRKMGGEPNTVADGVKLATWIVGGLGFNFEKVLSKTYGRAMEFANKNFRYEPQNVS